MIDAPIEGLSTVRYVYTPRISAAYFRRALGAAAHGRAAPKDCPHTKLIANPTS